MFVMRQYTEQLPASVRIFCVLEKYCQLSIIILFTIVCFYLQEYNDVQNGGLIDGIFKS